MSQQLLTVEDVANRLDLHTRTIRRHIREGRLKATRIGKSYRITETDLAAYAGLDVPAPSKGTADLHVSASSIVEVENVTRETAIRMTNGIVAAAGGQRQGDPAFRVDTVYDDERQRLKVICIGGLRSTQAIMGLVQIYAGGEA